MFMSKSRQSGYPEVQICGGVSIHDVKYVIIDGIDNETDNILNKLRELNIQFVVKER